MAVGLLTLGQALHPGWDEGVERSEPANRYPSVATDQPSPLQGEGWGEGHDLTVDQ